VKLVDENNAPLSGVTVNLTGPGSFSGVTNALGCVVFPFIPIGTYTATAQRNGYVDVDGDATPSQSLTVNQSQSTAVNFTMGNGATIQAQFETVVGATTIAAQSRWLSVANSKLTVSPRLFTATGTAPATATQINATSLFPFTNGYSVYPGQCTANAAGAKTYTPTPGQTLSTATNKLRVPSINIHVVNNASPTPANLTGATVMIEPSDYPTCPNVFLTQVSTTTTAGGAAALPNPGYPYGTYKLCAQNSGGTLHGHADIRSSGAYGTGHVDDTVNNATAGNNTTSATTDGAIRIQVNQTGRCHGFPQNGFP
jgi:hypothetical protein